MKSRNSVTTENFSRAFPEIISHIFNFGDVVESRNGDTLELLNFKTEITDPYKRCIGNNNRNSNVFFLLAESMWIWAGHKDVAFLEIFNEGMKNYSDDGESFHAPYGYRLRNWNHKSCDINREEYVTSLPVDQIKECIEILHNNPLDRQAVASIWNPNLDLGTKSLDKPCNDLLMFKIRNGELHTTISNRSNDLVWGLCTNVFQFSFVSELMALCLEVKLGTQTHNSQSLHVYVENKDYKRIVESVNSKTNEQDLYDESSEECIDFWFAGVSPLDKLKELDNVINSIITSLKGVNSTPHITASQTPEEVSITSSYLSFVYQLLIIYILYKKQKPSDETRIEAIQNIIDLSEHFGFENLDITHLSLNFFITRLKDRTVIGNFDRVLLKTLGDL